MACRCCFPIKRTPPNLASQTASAPVSGAPAAPPVAQMGDPAQPDFLQLSDVNVVDIKETPHVRDGHQDSLDYDFSNFHDIPDRPPSDPAEPRTINNGANSFAGPMNSYLQPSTAAPAPSASAPHSISAARMADPRLQWLAPVAAPVSEPRRANGGNEENHPGTTSVYLVTEEGAQHTQAGIVVDLRKAPRVAVGDSGSYTLAGVQRGKEMKNLDRSVTALGMVRVPAPPVPDASASLVSQSLGRGHPAGLTRHTRLWCIGSLVSDTSRHRGTPILSHRMYLFMSFRTPPTKIVNLLFTIPNIPNQNKKLTILWGS